MSDWARLAYNWGLPEFFWGKKAQPVRWIEPAVNGFHSLHASRIVPEWDNQIVDPVATITFSDPLHLENNLQSFLDEGTKFAVVETEDTVRPTNRLRWINRPGPKA